MDFSHFSRLCDPPVSWALFTELVHMGLAVHAVMKEAAKREREEAGEN